MSVIIVTGSAGLVGSSVSRYFHAKGFNVVGIDNDMRSRFFGKEASTSESATELKKLECYTHLDVDIRDNTTIDSIFKRYEKDIKCVVHTAAQPSHDWAVTDPLADFNINANSTLHLLEATRKHCPSAVFQYISTNKVYGDSVNSLPLSVLDTRWDLPEGHELWDGIKEDFRVDQTLHSLFGVSKLSADLLVQEYGRYFGMNTVCFRAGCLTGPNHAGTEMHGFLSYLMKCTMLGRSYTVYGYGGKQVRDNLHCDDLAKALYWFYSHPAKGAVYNIGGGRSNSCSVIEAINYCEQISGKKLKWTYKDANRTGDHMWWITDTRKFRSAFPHWFPRMGVVPTLIEIKNSVEKLQLDQDTPAS